MNQRSIEHAHEDESNQVRRQVAAAEPCAMRTFTSSQAVLARSAGIYHWTPEGRRLFDFTSGVLVANLGHNPRRWVQRLLGYLDWGPELWTSDSSDDTAFFPALPLTAYNALTDIEAQATSRLLRSVQSAPGGRRLDGVMWAASGSEAIQKALWAALSRDPARDLIIATRHGFHGKKGLSGAVSGSETDPERDRRVVFIGFPMREVDDVEKQGCPFDPQPYITELETLWSQFGTRLTCLITEPYLGGGGSYHPPAAYHHLLEAFCRRHDILFILDEVQANFGRTGPMYAFEKYGLEPDFVALGKGLGNGVPVAAVVGRRDIMDHLKYGDASDTWSANPLSCAAVLATLDEYETGPILAHARRLTPIVLRGLQRLKDTGLVAKVRGEGLVFGLECASLGEWDSRAVALECVRAAYCGQDGVGLHLLGPLAGNVIRISPPLIIKEAEAEDALQLLHDIFQTTAARLSSGRG